MLLQTYVTSVIHSKFIYSVFKKTPFKGLFFNFSSKSLHIHSYISFKNCCQEKNHLNIHMNFDAFSHGQIQSKLWLCKELEPFLPDNAKVAVLGSWYNLVAFMLLTRNPDQCQAFLGIDLDPDVKPIADKIVDAWTIDGKVQNLTADAGSYDVSWYDVIINCSPEHMATNDWFENLEYGKLVCIQSSDVTIGDDDVWLCVNPNEELDDLAQKYPMSKYLFSGTKEIRYSDDNGYRRFMIIGIK